MKSSGPLFGRQNPFQPASRVGKAHYHSSCNQSVLKKKKKTTLSPVRSNQRSSPQMHTLSPESQQPSDTLDNGFAATDGQPVFSESWPSTDCGSPPASAATSSNMGKPKQSARAGKFTVSSELGVQQDSVLAKYIERFRHGRPQSREERHQMASAVGEEQLPFWWMSPSSLPPSSTPTKTAHKDQFIQPFRGDHVPGIFSPAGQCQHDRFPSPCRGSLSILSDTSQDEFDDTEILHLQERANKLLLTGYENHSEGLGGSDFSSPVSVDEPVRRPFIPSLIKSNKAKASSNSVQAAPPQKSIIHFLGPPKRPEEDILFQWRLRRKMEQAREWPEALKHSSPTDPAFSWQAPSLSVPSAGGQAHKSTRPPEFSGKDTHPHVIAPQPEAKDAHRSYPPASGPPLSPASVASGSCVSQPQTVAHVPAHMHLLCDVLPCPLQLSHPGAQQNISQRLDEFQTKVVSKKIQVPGNPTDVFSDQPIREHMSLSTHASSGAIAKEWSIRPKRSEGNKKEKAQTKESQKNEKKAAMSIRKHTESTRYTLDKEHTDGPRSTKKGSSTHQRLPKKVKPLAELQQQEGSQEFSSERCTGGHAPPPSPVHSALGQVVSEVLFPTVDSSSAGRSPISLVSPPCTASANPQSPVPPCNTRNSMEVISQLLQEAEDSDENMFEDDPLLQVLRRQRKWVKEQISEVDSVLNEFLEQQVT
ncbi:proline and serine-rich protein 3 isoform X2 [Xiphias gladius]|uniref:proline and serine-rich protein 3 isoform X2 n=1 Tax=Xiphias gladius TaxID=8245 RepID=UPI001A99FA9C|nr:proline and serine-rich protein 3 isoform X2 [Xiphias gladius]